MLALHTYKPSDPFSIISDAVMAMESGSEYAGLSEGVLISHQLSSLEKFLKYKFNSSTHEPLDDKSMWKVGTSVSFFSILFRHLTISLCSSFS